MGRQSMEERFWSKVVKLPGDWCWEWVAHRTRDGYGTFSRRGSSALAHRVAWEMANGLIPAGMCVCHRCDNPRCVRPSHLFLGTVADNNADRDAKGRQAHGEKHRRLMQQVAAPPCLKGESNGQARLTDETVRRIREMRLEGMSQEAIALSVGVSQPSVSRALRGLTWMHVP